MVFSEYVKQSTLPIVIFFFISIKLRYCEKPTKFEKISHFFKRFSTVLCISVGPRPHELETRVIIIKKFDQSLLPKKLWLLFMGMKQNKIFFEKKIKHDRPKKTKFFKTVNFQYFYAKISGIGPWVSRINWCESINVAQLIWSSGCLT